MVSFDRGRKWMDNPGLELYLIVVKSYWQGTTINYTAILGGTNMKQGTTLVYSTHSREIVPVRMVKLVILHDYDGVYRSDQNQDTCPDLEGNDPVTNIMNYSDCPYDFTLGQAERAYYITEVYHPGLLENQFYYLIYF